MTIQTVAPVPADTEQAMREAGFTEAQIPRLLKLPGGEPRCREVLAWLPYWQSDPRVGNAIALAMRAIEKPEAYRPPAGYLRARQQALTLLEEHKGGKKIPTPADTERLLQEHAREEAERAAKDAEFQAHLARERAFLDECDRKRALCNGTTG